MNKCPYEYNARLPEQKPKLDVKNLKSCHADRIDSITVWKHLKYPPIDINLIKIKLYDLMMGKYDDIFQKLMVIDCRYGYEYSGGHIKNSINLNKRDDLDTLYNTLLDDNVPTCIVFHCEYSSHRGPKLYYFFLLF